MCPLKFLPLTASSRELRSFCIILLSLQGLFAQDFHLWLHAALCTSSVVPKSCCALGERLCHSTCGLWNSYFSSLESTSQRLSLQKLISAMGWTSSKQCLPFSRGAGEITELCEFRCEIWILKIRSKVILNEITAFKCSIYHWWLPVQSFWRNHKHMFCLFEKPFCNFA